MSDSSTPLNGPSHREPIHSFPPRFPFYYGWVMLPVAMMAHISTFPGQSPGIAVFNPSFREALNLSHSQLTGVYMVGSFLACLPMFAVGALMDRYGIRRTMACVVILFGGACLFTSQVSNLVTLGVAFLMLRTLGQGALMLLSDNTLAMWFRARLGIASGLKGWAWPIAIAVVPGFTLWLINSYGWRWAYAILGIIVWATMLPLLAFVFRNRPEDIGQTIDGGLEQNAVDESLEKEQGRSPQREMKLREAMRSRAYWIALGLFSTSSMIGTAIFFNIFPLFESFGRSQSEVIAVMSLFAVSMFVMQLVGGLLADVVRLNRLMSSSVALQVVALILLMNSRTAYLPQVFALIYGIGDGLLVVAGGTVWARYFGRTHLGKIRGSVWMAVVAGSSVGPFILGTTYDYFGRYDPALWLFVLLYAGFVVAVLFATPPQSPNNQVSTR